MQSPLISVIIPAYNHESYVSDAIHSVLKQSFTDFEMIVIDDGSTDNTLFEIKQISDPRIRLFHQENIGAAATINQGIELSQGRYITILNSDDLFHPDRLTIFKQYMDDHPDVMVVASLIQPIDASGNSLETASDNAIHEYWLNWYDQAIRTVYQDDHYFYSLLQTNFVVSTSNLFVRAELFRTESKFDPLLFYCHDFEFLLRVLQTHPFGFIKQKLLKYRLHDTNTIRQDNFLKRFEVQYAVFHALNFDKILSGPSNRKQRLTDILFRGLEKNPDINHQIILSEKNRMLESSESWLKESQVKAGHFEERLMLTEKQNECLQARIIEGDKQNECLQSRIFQKDDSLQEKDAHLHQLAEEMRQKDILLDKVGHEIEDYKRHLLKTQNDLSDKNCQINQLKTKIAEQEAYETELKAQIHHQDIRLHAADEKILAAENNAAQKEQFLQEIFHSKAWAWITRYRNIKLKIAPRPAIPQPPARLTDERTCPVRILHSLNSNRPKVIHAIANFLTGGSSRLVADLVEHLGHEYDQEVISFFIPKPLAYSGITLHDFSGDIPENRISDFIDEKGAQILHVHYWGEGDALWYQKIFRAAEKWPGILIENINTPVVPHISDRVDHYVYVSEYAKNFAACVPEKSSVIYPGSNLALFDRKNAPMPDDVIGMVYRLDPDKLKEDAIQVFIQVVKKRPRTRVLIVGGGYFFQSYQRQVAEEGASANFQFTNYVPYGHLPDYYKQLSIFVAPVWKESFGQVSPFAMSMKIPVVGYRIGALPEIVDCDDLLGKNQDDLSDIIVNLLNNRERRLEIGQQNYDRAHERFSVEAMIEAYDRLYERLIHERGK